MIIIIIKSILYINNIFEKCELLILFSLLKKNKIAKYTIIIIMQASYTLEYTTQY